MKKGVFITLEGGEGAGKSTLAQALIMFLQTKDIEVMLTREPGGTKEAEAIRSLVVSGDKDRFDSTTEALLFNAARRHHLTHSVLPALENGTWVICDRFVDSTFV
ncbi:MAG: dTMP kinase, partial [Alphaproteobacteria bacterium]|nr:dTMP kinase [Alphaproteobacteria bacterium]